MKKMVFLAVSIMFCLNAFASEKVTPALAIEYLKISKIEDIINASISQYETQLFAKAKPEEKEKFHTLLVNSMGWDVTKDQLADLVVKIYTKEEIDASIAFMKSPAGASATAKGEEFSKQFTSLIAANLQKAMASIKK